MSVISSRKSLNSSILKSAGSRNESLKKTKILRFEVNISSIRDILKELDDNPNAKNYQNLIYKLSEADMKVKFHFLLILRHILELKVISSCFRMKSCRKLSVIW